MMRALLIAILLSVSCAGVCFDVDDIPRPEPADAGISEG